MRSALPLFGAVAAALVLALPAQGAAAPRCATSAGGDAKLGASVDRVVRTALTAGDLRAVLVRVNVDGKPIYTRAYGESIAGVRATPAMHFRNGAVAYSYLATLLARLVDQRKVKFEDKVSKYLPALPNGDRITLRELANSTSGYTDYVYEPEVLNSVATQPLRAFKTQELIDVGTKKPLQHEPGKNFAYTHTGFAVLAQVLSKAGGRPIGTLLRDEILRPAGLRQTASANTPAIPQPVLNTYTSERRTSLGIPAGTPFFEDSTYWNPSWTGAEGVVMSTDICDLAGSYEAIGSGRLVSRAGFKAQTDKKLAGFGHPQAGCRVCRALTKQFSYGLGVLLMGNWIGQTKSFAGSAAAVAYLPSKRVSIAVEATFAENAYDDEGNYEDTTPAILNSLGKLLAPSDPIRP